jgi:ankyrin repeat protein
MDPMRLLFRTIDNGDDHVVNFLLKAGIDPNGKGEYPIHDSDWFDQYTALGLACEHNQLKIIDLLLEAGADVNQPNRHLERPLHCVCSNGNKIVAKLLLEAGAQIDVKDVDNKTPLITAMENGHEDIVELLLKYGAKNQINDVYNGVSPLMLAIVHCKLSMIILLLNAGANPNLPTTYPLHLASEIDYIDAVHVLLKSHADPLIRNEEGKLASDLAYEGVHEILLIAEASCQTIKEPEIN